MMYCMPPSGIRCQPTSMPNVATAIHIIMAVIAFPLARSTDKTDSKCRVQKADYKMQNEKCKMKNAK
jgi:hypothetical protein